MTQPTTDPTTDPTARTDAPTEPQSEPVPTVDLRSPVPADVEPVEFDWFHQFPCRYGNAVPGTRDFSYQRRTVKGSPFAWDTGARWCSARHLAAHRPPSDILMTGQTMFTRMAYQRNGVVDGSLIWLIPFEGLVDAIRRAEELLADDLASDGIKEWAPAYGIGPSGEHVGLHLRFYSTWQDDDLVRQRRFAEEVGAYGIVDFGLDHSIPYDPKTDADRIDIDYCALRDLDGTVRAHSLDGHVYSVDSSELHQSLPEFRRAVNRGRPNRRRRR